jgi:uncharacterized protein DUF4325
MVIRALDHVPNCYSWDSGDVISKIIRQAFSRGDNVAISFAGVSDIPTSFANAAFVSLLDTYSYDFIRSHLTLANCSRQIVDMVKRRFAYETSRPHAA